MSRRETFLESARAANDRSLETPDDGPREPIAAAQAQRVESELRQVRAAIAGLQEQVTRSAPSLGDRPTRALPRNRWWLPVTCLLAGAVIALLVVTLLRPEWAMRPRQRADLELGRRMHQLLDTMEETERSQVLASLWETSTSATTD